MHILVTAGPSYEPIDEVRRITNFSTGELGVLLSNRLAQAGLRVTCLKGVCATHPGALIGCEHRPFTTNDDLLDSLRQLSQGTPIGAVFHVAALADFRVKRAEDSQGTPQRAAKISSRDAGLTLYLEPARKIISELRSLFPKAVLVGWKYELNGGRDDALGQAWRQLGENRTDACVLNGKAWGNHFGVCTPPDSVVELPDKVALVEFLTTWVQGQPGRP